MVRGTSPRSELLSPTPRLRLFEQVEMQIRDYIESGAIAIGERLPPERLLAEKFSVSRVTVRQATLSLESQGMVDVRHGDGTYLCSKTPRVDVIRPLIAKRARLPDILEAREVLECRIAFLAARRRSEEDLARIEEAVGQMRAEVDQGQIGDRGDAVFHAAVTRAAGNAVLADLMAHLDDRITESRTESLSEPGRPRQSLAAHERIAREIRAGDARRAEIAMRRHLRQVADVHILRWQIKPDTASSGVQD